ncbi:hydrolase [Sporolactobacillus inulinus]|uniref:Hydrolase n=1 Tax=Sporolactobacillus inulinus TaxID=2078 RepID=A0A4Y1ZDK1_9BACL|nr:Cof-type HAD-IIB family hydrolase [Sporolactobacillus inulinus]GAY77145.1 hydrolase [Sporolactobacillus inulinus]
MHIETVMLDLDGTTLTPENQVTPELNAYLKKLRSLGKRVFVITGRTEVDALNALPSDFPHEGMVASNGMAVFAGGEKIFQSALPSDLVQLMIRRSEEQHMYYQLHPIGGRRTILNRDKSYVIDQIQGEKPHSVGENEWNSRSQAVLEDMVWKDALTEEESAQIAKMYFFSSDPSIMDTWKQELNGLQQTFAFDQFSSSRNNVELVGRNISKASGVRRLLDYFDLSPEHALAIGDGENDLPMFQIAGHSAAMKNAPDHVKAQAKWVTESPYDQNGLYNFLRTIFH